MKKFIILLLAICAYAEVPHIIPQDISPDKLPALLNRNFEYLSNRNSETNNAIVGISTGIAEEKSNSKYKKLYLKDVRAEQRYTGAGQVDDNGQTQMDTLYGTALFRVAGVDDLYRTIEDTFIYFLDGSAYSITLDGTTGQSKWLGRMVHYSTSSVWSSDDYNVIEIDGYIPDEDVLGKYSDGFYDGFNVMPVGGKNPWRSLYNSWTNKYISNGNLVMSGSTAGSSGYNSTNTYTINSTGTVLSIWARLKGDSLTSNLGMYLVVGIEDGSYTSPHIGVELRTSGIAGAGTAWANYWNGTAFVSTEIDLAIESNTYYDVKLTYTHGTMTYDINGVTGSVPDVYTGELRPTVGISKSATDGNNVAGYIDYFREAYNVSTGTLANAYAPSKIHPLVDTLNPNRGLEIDVGDSNLFLSASGGVGLYSGVSWDWGVRKTAEAGKLTLHNPGDMGIEFDNGVNILPVDIVYDGETIAISTTTSVDGNFFVTGYSSTSGNAYVTGDTYGTGISSHSYYYGDGRYLKNRRIDTLVSSQTILNNQMSVVPGSITINTDGISAIVSSQTILNTKTAVIFASVTINSDDIIVIKSSITDIHDSYATDAELSASTAPLAVATEVWASTDTLQDNIDTEETARINADLALGVSTGTNLMAIQSNDTDILAIGVSTGTNKTSIDANTAQLTQVATDTTTLDTNKLDNTSDTMSGSLDIGTTLDVTGATTLDSTLSVGGILNTNSNWISGDGGAEGLQIDAGGQVGVNEATPTQKLEVNGAVSVIGAATSPPNPYSGLALDWYTGTARISSYGAGTTTKGAYSFAGLEGDAGSGGGGAYQFYMNISSNGYIGINNTNPSYQLDVNGTGRFVGALTTESGFYGSGANLTGVVKDAELTAVSLSTGVIQTALDAEIADTDTNFDNVAIDTNTLQDNIDAIVADTSTVISDFKKSTNTFTGQNTMQNTLWISSSIEYSGGSKIYIDAINRLYLRGGTGGTNHGIVLDGGTTYIGNHLSFLGLGKQVEFSNASLTQINWAGSDTGFTASTLTWTTPITAPQIKVGSITITDADNVIASTVPYAQNADLLDGQEGAYYAIKSAVASSTDTLESNKLDNTSDTMSGSLDIGTTLDVTGAATLDSTLSVGGILNTNNQWISGDGGAEGLNVTDAGVIGICITPKVWDSIFGAIELGYGSSIAGLNAYSLPQTYVNNNTYYNDGWKYINSDEASQIYMPQDGTIRFNTAPSGTAGEAVTTTEVLSIANDGIITTSTSIYCGGTVSATDFIDRTPYPETLQIAYDEIMSVDRDINNPKMIDKVNLHKNLQVKKIKNKLLNKDEFLKGAEPIYEVTIEIQRNVSETVSALVEVIKDLKARIEALEK